MPESTTIEVIKAIGAIITPIAVAWIAFQQVKLAKSVNGKMTQLLEVTGAKERAEGKLEEKADRKAETNQSEKPVDVVIVDQTKPVDVKPIK